MIEDRDLDIISTMSDIISAVTDAAREGVVDRVVATQHVSMYLKEAAKCIDRGAAGGEKTRKGVPDGSDSAG